MTLNRAALLALLAGLMFAPVAEAKKDKADPAAETMTEVPEAPTIEDTGVPAFDAVFAEVSGIHGSLDEARTRLAAANNSVVMALKLPADASLDDALSELKDKAGGDIAVIMNGTVPTLSASNALPEDISAAIEAVNAAVQEVAQAQESLAALPDQTAALVEQVKAFRTQLNPTLMVESGLERSEMPRIASTTKKNVEATVATHARIMAVGEELARFMDTMKDFGAGLASE